jgi:curved DNA-binding protein CbpA
MAVYTDLYAALNVDVSASRAEIQRAFKDLSRQFHPDKQMSSSITASHKEASEEVFKLIRQAHDVLSDRVLRLAYDTAGMMAVDVVLRSHYRPQKNTSTSSPSHKEEEEKEGEGDSSDDDNDDDEETVPSNRTHDLYIAIQQAASHRQALDILQRALDQKEMLEASARWPPLDATYICPCYVGEASDALLETSSPTLSFQTKRTIIPQWDWLLASTSQLRRNGRLEARSQWSLTHHRLGFGPIGTLDVVCNHTNDTKGPLLKLQTSRALSTGTSCVVSLSGHPRQGRTWMYTLSTSRHLLLPSSMSNNKDNNSNHPSPDMMDMRKAWHASWTIALNCYGQVQFLQAEVRRLSTVPRGFVRLGLDALTVQVESSEWLVLYSQQWLWHKCKLLHRIWTWGKWKVECGVSYDGQGRLDQQGRYMGGSAWKFLVHVQSNEWDIRFPFALSPLTEPMARSWLVSRLIGSCMEQFVEHVMDTTTMKGTTKQPWIGPLSVPESSLYTPWIAHVAAKKRQQEDASNGLVILQAWSRNFGHSINIIDHLQYWVVSGSLRLELQEVHWWPTTALSTASSIDDEGFAPEMVPTTTTTKPKKSKSKWVHLLEYFVPSLKDDNDGDTSSIGNELYIRYQFKDCVYEVMLDNVSILTLPHPNATLMGRRGNVL